MDPIKALETAFTSVDNDYCSLARKLDLDDGSTASVLLLRDGEYYLAAAGDSRAVLVMDDGSVEALSDDHNPDRRDERLRVTKLGGMVEYDQENETYRVFSDEVGGLAVTRAIGALSPLFSLFSSSSSWHPSLSFVSVNRCALKFELSLVRITTRAGSCDNRMALRVFTIEPGPILFCTNDHSSPNQSQPQTKPKPITPNVPNGLLMSLLSFVETTIIVVVAARRRRLQAARDRAPRSDARQDHAADALRVHRLGRAMGRCDERRMRGRAARVRGAALTERSAQPYPHRLQVSRYYSFDQKGIVDNWRPEAY